MLLTVITQTQITDGSRAIRLPGSLNYDILLPHWQQIWVNPNPVDDSDTETNKSRQRGQTKTHGRTAMSDMEPGGLRRHLA